MPCRQPNILIVMADQFRNSALGFRGEDPTYTPHLDAFAAESMDVRHAVSSYPVCSPHRAMFMTGQHPHRNGVPVNINSTTGAGLKPDIDTWSSVLHANGYNTGYIGKWHLEAVTEEDALWGEGYREGAVWDAYSPPDRRHGFSFWYSYGAADDHMRPHYWIGDAAREEKTTVEQWSVEHETEVAIRFLREAAGSKEPFALMVSHNPPHQPFHLAPPTHRQRYEAMPLDELLRRRNVDLECPPGQEAICSAPQYFAAVSAVDGQIGRLLRELSALGMADDTIVIFTSDHGMQLGSHGLMYKNVPWEESMSIPFLIRWPGHIQAAADNEVLLSSVDFAPTLLGLAGLSEAIPDEMQGDDLSSELRGRSARAYPLAVYYGPPGPNGRPGMRGLRTREHKLIAGPEDGVAATSAAVLSVELYDLVEDPYELHNIAATSSALAHVLGMRLVRKLADIGDPWPCKERLAAHLREQVAGGPSAQGSPP